MYDVYGIGNALVDSEYEVADSFLESNHYQKGSMTLVDAQQRADLIVALEEKQNRHKTKLSGGGSAANTMVIIAQLGGKAFYSCKVANDSTGDFFVKDLDEAGVATNLKSNRESGITGECISMISPDAERTLMTHLGISESLSTADLNPSALEKSSYLYIEGYLVSSPTGLEAALAAQSIAKKAGVAVSLTLSDMAMVENFRAEFDALIDQGVDLLFCNEDEARIWTQTNNREDMARKLGQSVGSYALTCGGDGAYVAAPNQQPGFIEASKKDPLDTTGAGDIFAGTLLYHLVNGKTIAAAAQYAHQAAAILVQQFGARLENEDISKLKQLA
ncbi:MAG: adenosine kinase [Gammaproteobacteria bacterium]|nr:adenosine kinase [Gammaproteobacteria bacterium]MBT5602860.1 adenosine kinase [Gammaproteobacteria bacterium]MBT6246268.1 adenosine kinase [Gammaproteobacteria bacterium]